MPSRENLLLAELAVEKYAQARGLDVKAVKEKWLPILEAEDDKDEFTQSLTQACAVLGQIKEIAKGLDPETQSMLGKLSAVAVQRALTPGEKESDDGDEKLVRTVRRIKILDHAFEDPDDAAQVIAEKVSAEVSTPLTAAIDRLNATVEKVNTAVSTVPTESVASNPEFTALQKMVEGINAKLEDLGKQIQAGPPTPQTEDNVEHMIEQINSATERSKNFLTSRGFKISPGETPATLDEARKIVENSGYTLLDQRVTREDAKKMADQAAEAERKKHDVDMEMKLEEKKIEAAKEVTKAAIDQVMKPFSYFIERFLNTSINPEAAVPTPGTGTPPASQSTPTPTNTQIVEVKKPQV